jgi:hypothetical protein
MKKKAKTLRLAKETVRRLTGTELGQVEGAESTECMTAVCPTAETPCGPTFICPTTADC